MPYDRYAAIGYAKRYWDQPCDDGIIWRNDGKIHIADERVRLRAASADGWEPRFVKDPNGDEEAVFERFVAGKTQRQVIQPWVGLADCAHFLSRCLSAGGLKIAEISVPTLISHLKSRSDVKVLAEQVNRERGQMIVDTGVFKRGDMVGYFNIDPHGDYNGVRQYSHSAMYVGKIKAKDDGHITCHTMSRFPGLSSYPDEWHLQKPAYTYSFIHIAQDDVAPSPTFASSLVGWWQRSGGVGGYYYLRPDGRADFTMHAPSAHHEAPRGVLNTAYWFQRSTSVAIFWRKGGNLEEWKSTGRPQEFATSVNRVLGSPVIKLAPPPPGHTRR